jgi:hypothetical protein
MLIIKLKGKKAHKRKKSTSFADPESCGKAVERGFQIYPRFRPGIISYDRQAR